MTHFIPINIYLKNLINKKFIWNNLFLLISINKIDSKDDKL